MAKSTDCAVRLIGRNDALAEGLLVKPRLNLSRHVSTASVRFGILNSRRVDERQPAVVDVNHESEGFRRVPDDENRPDCEITPFHDAVEVSERSLRLHRQPQADVVAMSWICAPIAVPHEAIASYDVWIWCFFAFSNSDGCDAQRHRRQDGRFEDSLGADQRHTFPIKGETLRKHCAWQNVASGYTDLSLQKSESGGPHTGIELIQHIRTLGVSDPW